jgi:hypothetical protein
VYTYRYSRTCKYINFSRNQTANICSSFVVVDENIGFCERINSYFIILKTTSESNHFLILSTKESHASLIVVNILTSTISIVVEVVVISDICRE